MWTVNNQRHAEPRPEVKAKVQALFEEWVRSGDQRLIEQARLLCGRGGHEWFEAMLVDAKRARRRQEEMKGSQTVHDMPGASTGKAGTAEGATSSPDAVRPGVAPLATPKGTHSASPSTGAEASPLTNPILARRYRIQAEAEAARLAAQQAAEGRAADYELADEPVDKPGDEPTVEPEPEPEPVDEVDPFFWDGPQSSVVEDQNAEPTAAAPKRVGVALLSNATPLETAKAFARRYCRQQDFLACYHWQGEFWEWNGKHYEAVGDDIMRDRMVQFLGQSKKLEAGRPAFNPRTQNVTEALDMLKTNIRLAPKCQPPMWLKQGASDPDAADLLAFGNGLVNVRTGQRLAPQPIQGPCTPTSNGALLHYPGGLGDNSKHQ
jgi:hypothetical protein